MGNNFLDMDFLQILLEQGLPVAGIIFLVIKGIPWILEREGKRTKEHETRLDQQVKEHQKRMGEIIEKHERRMEALVQDYKEHTNLTNTRLEEINSRLPEIVNLGKQNERLQQTLELAEKLIQQNKA